MTFLELERAVHDAELSLRECISHLRKTDGEVDGLMPKIKDRAEKLVRDLRIAKNAIRFLSDTY